MKLTTPNLADIPRMIDIQQRAFIQNYANQEFGQTKKQVLQKIDWEQRKLDRAEQIVSPKCLWVGIKEGEQLLGYGCLGDLDQETLHLYSIMVDPDFQKRGIGRMIVSYLLTHAPAKKIELETTIAVYFYKKFGFQSLKTDKFKMFLTKSKLAKFQKDNHQ